VHLSPAEFHAALNEPNVVVIDVRNKNEYEIGHFENAVNPSTRTFAEFPRFVQNNLSNFKDKKVLMYCTGGIRCEKASLFLKENGLQEVYQLNGGIHRYIEAFPGGGKFVGKNVVFDRRCQVPTNSATIVGRCTICTTPYDNFQGDRVCAVCRDPVIVCEPCKLQQRGVFYCSDHDYLKGSYYYFLEGFTVQQLDDQLTRLQYLHNTLLAGTGKETHKKRNPRKTISKQIEKVKAEIVRLNASTSPPTTLDPASWRCRTCGDWNDICDGNCWGYFQAPALAEGGTRSLEEIRKLPHKISPARQTIEPLS
jgi:rhodanese-related sulfurtransferase